MKVAVGSEPIDGVVISLRTQPALCRQVATPDGGHVSAGGGNKMDRREERSRSMTFVRRSFMATAGVLLFGSAAIASENYPSKPIRLVVPYPAGGGSDIVARLVSQNLGEDLGQQLVIDNRPGASGIIGCELAAKAPADGYTLLFGSSGNLSINPTLYPKLPYKPLSDFQPISLTTAGPQILIVHPSVPAKSVKELVALAKAAPGKLNFASGGTGTGNHLASELFKLAADIQIVHVPYKGAGQAMSDLSSGQVQMMISSPLPAMPHVNAGRLRVLAVTSLERTPLVPGVPTIRESGLKDFETTSWHGVLVPLKTPKAISVRLEQALMGAMKRADAQKQLAMQGVDTVGSSSKDFVAYIRSETKKFAKVIELIRIKP